MPKAKRARRPALKLKAVARGKKSPARKKPSLRNVDSYVRLQPASMQPIVNRVRALVAAAAPEATESLKWGQPVYEVNGPMAYIKAYKGWVNFGFWRGAMLQAPAGFLEGEGTRMKHVKLRAIADLTQKEEALKGLVRQAALLNSRLGSPTRRG